MLLYRECVRSQGAEAAVAVVSMEAFDRLKPPASIERAAEEQVKLEYFKEQLEEKLAIVRASDGGAFTC